MKRSTTTALALGGVGVVAVARRRSRAGVFGPLARTLRVWQPTPPRSVTGRLLAYAWASPVTLAGLLAGAGAGVRPRLQDGVVLFAPAGGLVRSVLLARGFAAAALGHTVLSVSEPTAALFTHELVHVRQAERLGPLMAPLYLGLLAVHGYRRHPMEVAASRAAAAVEG